MNKEFELISSTFPNINRRYEVVDILGVPFTNISKKEMVDELKLFAESSTEDNQVIVTANPEIVYYAHKNKKYMQRISAAHYIVPDGIGVIKAAKKLKTPLKERVAGIELMEEMLKIADDNHSRVFLLGASKETVKKCKKKLRAQYPNIIFKSKHGYKDVRDYKTLLKVRKFDPDYIFVAMGYPKQETWIYYHQHHFTHCVLMGVGGSFDVFSGNVKRAPELFIKMNLEWLYRIMTDMKRFKRAVSIPLFMMEISRQKYRRDTDPHANLRDKV